MTKKQKKMNCKKSEIASKKRVERPCDSKRGEGEGCPQKAMALRKTQSEEK